MGTWWTNYLAHKATLLQEVDGSGQMSSITSNSPAYELYMGLTSTFLWDNTKIVVNTTIENEDKTPIITDVSSA